MRWWWLPATLIVAACLPSCTRDVTRSDLIGIWNADGKEFDVRLTLREDGSFEQVYTKQRAVEAVTRGTWTLEQDGRRRYILMRHIGGSTANPFSEGVSSHTIKASWGRLALEDNPEEDIEYVRE